MVYTILTFVAIFVVDREIKVGPITKAALDDNITFELEYGDTSSVKLHSGWLFLGLEFEKY